MAGEGYQTIRKAVSVLEALGDGEEDALRAADIERAVKFTPSTTVRILASLESHNLVERDSSQRYTLGVKLLELATQELNHDPVFRESRMMCQSLAQETGLNANVARRSTNTAVYICHFEGTLSPKSRSLLGLSLPMHASALGKCMMMDMDENERRELLGNSLQAFTAKTIATHSALTAQIQEARGKGYCLENEELAFGRMCVAAPIRNASSEITAGISVSGRLSLLRKIGVQSIAEQVIETADRISVNLGMISGH